MRIDKRNAGFGIVEIIVVLVVLALVGLIGYRVWDANMNKQAPATTSQNENKEISEDTAPEIKSSEDLDKADAALDETNVEGNSEAELNEQTSF